jgi:multicomponent Na+:H+ antiporter subunit E
VPPMAARRNVLNLWITLFAIWLILNASLDAQVVLAGIVVALLLTLGFARFSRAFADIRLTPRAIFSYLVYFAVFLQELVRANLNVVRLVFSPRIDIHPGIVEIKTRLASPTGRLVLANSITLTPGTLTVDIQGDSLFIHWINVTDQDPEAATRRIAAKFERYLEVIYG